jgi:hypothetical protein
LDVQTTQWTPGKLSRRDLLRNLGRDSFVLKGHDYQIRISWMIQFDWIGEAESIVQVEPSLPAVWYESDERKSLENVPSMFQALVRKRGVYEAIHILVSLFS